MRRSGPHDRFRHSFCSYAVALKCIEWTSNQGDHSIAILKRHYAIWMAGKPVHPSSLPLG
jgi:uncharacterized protein (UPF0305 family)